jgi:hypothetical protein
MKDKLRSLLVPILAAAVAAGVAVVVMNRNSGNSGDSAQSQSGQNSLIVGYAQEGVTVVDDQEAFDKAVGEAIARSQEPGVSLNFKNEAYSSDGKNFSCYLGNSESNGMDMFIAIYTDNTFEDELFLSELLRPGQAFESITLNRTLEPGSHDVVAAFSLVTEENGQQAIAKQTFVGLRFNVS